MLGPILPGALAATAKIFADYSCQFNSNIPAIFGQVVPIHFADFSRSWYALFPIVAQTTQFELRCNNSPCPNIKLNINVF
jgi:hypothetical protein